MILRRNSLIAIQKALAGFIMDQSVAQAYGFYHVASSGTGTSGMASRRGGGLMKELQHWRNVERHK